MSKHFHPTINIEEPPARSVQNENLEILDPALIQSSASINGFQIHSKLVDLCVQSQDNNLLEFKTDDTVDDFRSPRLEYNMPPPPEKTYAEANEMTKALKEHALQHGYAISIRRSVGKRSKTYKCERGGKYDCRRGDNRERKRGSRLIDCGFQVVGSFSKKDQLWHLHVKNPIHNHPPRTIPPAVHHSRSNSRANQSQRLNKPSLSTSSISPLLSQDFTQDSSNSSSSAQPVPFQHFPQPIREKRANETLNSCSGDLPVSNWAERFLLIKNQLELLDPAQREFCVQKIESLVSSHSPSSSLMIPSPP